MGSRMDTIEERELRQGFWTGAVLLTIGLCFLLTLLLDRAMICTLGAGCVAIGLGAVLFHLKGAKLGSLDES